MENMMEEDTQNELISIETKLAYLEDFVQQLQEVTVEHTNQIETLREENKLMAQKIRDLTEQLEGDVPNRKPPHY